MCLCMKAMRVDMQIFASRRTIQIVESESIRHNNRSSIEIDWKESQRLEEDGKSQEKMVRQGEQST